MYQIQNFINGKYVSPLSREYFEGYNPATGQVIAQVPNSNAQDLALAVSAAKAAQPQWAALSGEERGKYLWKIAQLIEANLERLANAECEDAGKPIALAKAMDIPRAAANFYFFANAASQFASEAHITNPNMHNYTIRQALGVVGCISPWNLPLYLFTWKIAPAMAAGNCVIAKPSEITPLTAYMLGEICQQASLPLGVLNILHGYGYTIGAEMVKHPEVKAISFTGSTRVGAEIARVAAPMFKKISLEMGGKNATIVCREANPKTIADNVVRAAFTNQGQICLCGSRILIHQDVYEEYKQRIVAQTQSLQVGNPRAIDTQQGALVSKQHYNKVLSYLDLAVQEGGKVLCGGTALQLEGECANGWFVAPTLIEGLPNDCRTNQEEIFGPVATLQSFSTDEEALYLANQSNYGLSANVFTDNLTQALRFANGLDAGIIWINTWLARDLRTPFGGMKDSGVGREGGTEAMRFFTEAKNVCIKI